MAYIITYDRCRNEWHATCTMFPDLRHVHDCPRKALEGLFRLFDAAVEWDHHAGAH